MTQPPIGHPDNEKTIRASVDAVMLAQAFYRDDDEGVQAILKHCDPYSVALSLCGFIYATFRQFDVDTEERLGIWLAQTRQEIGNPVPDELPPQIPDDPRGWLTFNAPLPDDLQRGEDSTQYADFHAEKVTWQYEAATDSDYFTRPATDTEKTLLGLLGHDVPDELTTRVSFPSTLVRRRRWPALETEQEAS